ncbi:hypothetical protein AB1N83_001367 [Pleurotus pulmonarius]
MTFKGIAKYLPSQKVKEFTERDFQLRVDATATGVSGARRLRWRCQLYPLVPENLTSMMGAPQTRER